MDRVNEIITRVKQLLEPVLDEGGFELIDVEFKREGGRYVLRIYVDRPSGGITLSDCEWISRRIGVILDVEDVIPFSYNLEVSSPGLNRALRTERDFAKHIGDVVKVSTVEPIDNQRNFKGKILSVSDGGIIIHDVSKNADVKLTYTNIKKSKLDLDALFKTE